MSVPVLPLLWWCSQLHTLSYHWRGFRPALRCRCPNRTSVSVGRSSVRFAPASRSAFPRLLFLVSALCSALVSSFSGLLLTIYFPVMGCFQTKCLTFAELYLRTLQEESEDGVEKQIRIHSKALLPVKLSPPSMLWGQILGETNNAVF